MSAIAGRHGARSFMPRRYAGYFDQ